MFCLFAWRPFLLPLVLRLFFVSPTTSPFLAKMVVRCFISAYSFSQTDEHHSFYALIHLEIYVGSLYVIGLPSRPHSGTYDKELSTALQGDEI